MLECGVSYQGTLTRQCKTCNKINNEENRLKHCIKYMNINYINNTKKIAYEAIFATDVESLSKIIQRIKTFRNVKPGQRSIQS